MIVVAIYGFFTTKYQLFFNLRGIFNVLVILYLLKEILLRDNTSLTIYFFIGYLFILCFFSSNIFLSLVMTVKTAIGMVMFMVGKRYFSLENSFNKLASYYYYLLLFLIGVFVFSNIFGIGIAGYGEDSNNPSDIYYGGLGVAITKLLLIPVLLTPLIISKYPQGYKRTFVIIAIFIGLIISIIAFKRSSTMALIAGALVYLLFLKKTIVVKYMLIILLFGFITAPFYVDYVIESYTNRSDQLYGISDEAETVEKEARYWETEAVINALKTESVFHVLFGSELFNEFDYFKTNRMLHIDYNVIINGSGIIGITLFLLTYFFIIKRSFQFYIFFKNWHLKMIGLSIISIILFAIFISIGGSVRSFDFRGPIFLYAGAALGYLENEYIRLKRMDSLELVKTVI